MRKARHPDISRRLEITKHHGLVEDYRIEWPPVAFRAPHVTVKGRTTIPAIVTKNYVAALLAPFIASDHIHIT